MGACIAGLFFDLGMGWFHTQSLGTLNNIRRRKALSELGMRVLFQMSANDSASLIDSPKAGSLGLNRALFYSEHESRMETFRPFALPGAEWVTEV